MNNKTIEINTKTGTGFTGYLSLPKSSTGPGLILIQEIFGVNSHIREVADLYAAAGYVVLAPDMFWRVQPHFQVGYTADDMQKARDMSGKCDREQMVFDLIDAVTALKDRPECTRKIGTVGYCMGGYLAYRLAVADAVDVAVGYYGGSIDQHLDKAGNLHCPLMLHFGALDSHITAQTVDRIKKVLADKGDVEVYVYDNADHGFNCEQREAYNRQAAMLAFGRSMIMLKKSLT